MCRRSTAGFVGHDRVRRGMREQVKPRAMGIQHAAVQNLRWDEIVLCSCKVTQPCYCGLHGWRHRTSALQMLTRLQVNWEKAQWNATLYGAQNMCCLRLIMTNQGAPRGVDPLFINHNEIVYVENIGGAGRGSLSLRELASMGHCVVQEPVEGLGRTSERRVPRPRWRLPGVWHSARVRAAPSRPSTARHRTPPSVERSHAQRAFANPGHRGRRTRSYATTTCYNWWTSC
jgi:hypothetical protein